MPIGESYGLDLEVVNHAVDPTFRFMTVDWDGQIRMDPSSSLRDGAAGRPEGAIRRRLRKRPGCRPARNRQPTAKGCLNPNHYLSVAIRYLFANRTAWPATVAVGKTVVSSSMIDRVAAHVKRRLVEVPVGFKWFVRRARRRLDRLLRRGERGGDVSCGATAPSGRPTKTGWS